MDDILLSHFLELKKVDALMACGEDEQAFCFFRVRVQMELNTIKLLIENEINVDNSTLQQIKGIINLERQKQIKNEIISFIKQQNVRILQISLGESYLGCCKRVIEKYGQSCCTFTIQIPKNLKSGDFVDSDLGEYLVIVSKMDGIQRTGNHVYIQLSEYPYVQYLNGAIASVCSLTNNEKKRRLRVFRGFDDVGKCYLVERIESYENLNDLCNLTIKELFNIACRVSNSKIESIKYKFQFISSLDD